MSGSFIVVQYFTRSPKARKHSSANTPKSSLRQDSISRQKQKQARCLYVLEEWIKAESESYTTLLLRNPPYSSSRACGMSQWYSVTKGSIPTWTRTCMFYTSVRASYIYIYIYTCVRVQNRALLNARRANDYTILEQLVDEIIVISDPLFIWLLRVLVILLKTFNHGNNKSPAKANCHRNDWVTWIDSTYWEICVTRK